MWSASRTAYSSALGEDVCATTPPVTPSTYLLLPQVLNAPYTLTHHNTLHTPGQRGHNPFNYTPYLFTAASAHRTH
ncbi:hypothetical protein E2C01_053921 [Portunus trituberculatus]|uniref:Uncharacterized protein n=1 Tax=Portunus trituberculatus TaxID=210409 RepID=A0A5B7GLM2_PORTR|nr:hypothetical protein [Portunus trituberculatus]